MDGAALPGAGEHPGDRTAQPLVLVGDAEAHALQAAPESPHSKRAQASTDDTASTAAATASSTALFIESRSPRRVHPPARAYLERKQAEGKSRREAIRCLKRQLARTVYNTLKAIPALT